jgi:hypothetical protein
MVPNIKEVRQLQARRANCSTLHLYSENAMRNANALATKNPSISMTDILAICRQYALLGLNIQGQVEAIMTFGVEEAIDSGLVSVAALPHIKDFLSHITSQAYFGVAAFQANECLEMLEGFENTHPNLLGEPAN